MELAASDPHPELGCLRMVVQSIVTAAVAIPLSGILEDLVMLVAESVQPTPRGKVHARRNKRHEACKQKQTAELLFQGLLPAKRTRTIFAAPVV